MAVTVVGHWVPFIYCAVLAVAVGSIEPGLYVESATCPKVSCASPLCLLSCSLTVLPPALIQWSLEFALFVLLIMHQSRNQKKKFLVLLFLTSVPSKTMLELSAESSRCFSRLRLPGSRSMNMRLQSHTHFQTNFHSLNYQRSSLCSCSVSVQRELSSHRGRGAPPLMASAVTGTYCCSLPLSIIHPGFFCVLGFFVCLF